MKALQYIFCTVFLIVLSGCVAGNTGFTGNGKTDTIRYTKVNIHTETKDNAFYKASYANYTDPGEGHYIIPAGSEIVITRMNRDGFYFTFDNASKKGFFEFHRARMDMSLEEYLDKISSTQPTSLKDLSSRDLEGIKRGEALVGMSRQGVMVALGYPATHRTPSLNASSWIYWTNRFGTIAVDFNSNGKVSRVRD